MCLAYMFITITKHMTHTGTTDRSYEIHYSKDGTACGKRKTDLNQHI
jgi:hypothetical protein